ncbi:hypothetical protein [Actinacidiphila yeochonensis]|uniref:hypothetical protein n=1 Tax=Actinacidiphila yeochonensis TaxID=89050 RepID=UPI0007C84D18|nr:hypothetical protein [Actinacidiphila yeochonensis]
MDIDPSQPWGIAIDYFGRASVADSGHDVAVRIYDQTLGSPLAPDPVTDTYPAVYVTAQISESGSDGTVLTGNGLVYLQPSGTSPVAPDQTSVPAAVAAAVADFQTRATGYAALCATWLQPADGGDAANPPTDDGSGSTPPTDDGGTGTDTGTDGSAGTDPGTAGTGSTTPAADGTDGSTGTDPAADSATSTDSTQPAA